MASNNTHVTASDCINANVISLFSTVNVLYISTYSFSCINYDVTNVYEHVSVTSTMVSHITAKMLTLSTL